MMSERQPFLTTQERDRSEAAAQEAARTASPTSRQPPRWSARRRRDGWFLLCVLLLGMITIIVLANVTSATRVQPGTASTSATQRPSVPPSVSMATSKFREYPLP